MMELFRTILLRVTLAGAAASLALEVAKDSALREIVRLGAGLLMALALLQPLAQIRLPDLTAAGGETADTVDIAALEAENRQTTMNTLGSVIADVLERRAAEAGIDCRVTVTMRTDAEGLVQTDRVRVRYSKKDAGRLAELKKLLTEECGVPEERQELIER